MDLQKELRDYQPQKEIFIGIDSDGCVFDSMEAKQKQVFIPNALRVFNLYKIEKELRETWEFVNLYSLFRGNNRYTALLKVFELLSEREEVRKKDIRLPDLDPLREWTEKETRLGIDALREYYEQTGDERLSNIIQWSESVNKGIREELRHIPPFPYALRALETISESADILVVSQTPLKDLEHEWKVNNIRRYARIIAGQEHGTKTEHIALAAKGKYDNEKILMIGDARGDLDAAVKNNIMFYPVIPGRENESWKKFLDEGYSKFINGSYRGKYEDDLIKDFLFSLPLNPVWRSSKS